MEYDLAIVAGFVVAYAAVSGRLARTVISGPMVYVAFGVLVGESGLGWLEFGGDTSIAEVIFEATLALLLFTDASRIDLRKVRRDVALPARLLGVGFPLTIGAGFLAAVVLFDAFSLGEAALVAAILAPTDAALGQAVVTNPRVPVRIRTGLNAESGLNDGLAVPFVTVFVAVAAAEEGLESAGFWVAFALKEVGYGLLVGVIAGYVGGLVIRRAKRAGWVLPIWRQIGTAAIVAVAYGVATPLEGNGFIASFVAGVAFGFVTREETDDAVEFAEEGGQLLTVITFVLFGAAVVGPALDDLTWQIGLYAVLSLTVVRMVPVALALLGENNNPRTTLFIGWFGPRGLASILLTLIVLEEALPQHELTTHIVTWTVLLSVYAHGISARLGANAYADWYEANEHRHDEMMEAEPAHEQRPPPRGDIPGERR